MPLRVAVGIPIAVPLLPEAPVLEVFGAPARYPLVQQQTDYWCWVACVAMIEKVWHGVMRKQCVIAATELNIPGCCSSPDFHDCDVPATLAGVTIAFGHARPGVAMAVPVSQDWLIGQLAYGAVGVLWEWTDTSGGAAAHVVLVVEARELGGGDWNFVVHDPALTAPVDLSYDELLIARGEGRWSYAWTNV